MIRVLNIHAAYACQHSGACCSSGWRIPLEPQVAAGIARAAAARRLPPHAARTETDGRLTVLALGPNGVACTALEPASGGERARCAIHRVLGHEALPSACRHFPRVCLLDPRGVSITLSHYCPTAASLLFDATHARVKVLEDPPGFASWEACEGLDARETLPPLLRPDLLMDLESYAAWEAGAIRVLDCGGRTVETALAEIGRGVERLRTWSPREGPLLPRVLGLRDMGSDPTGSDPVGSDPEVSRFCEVRDCVPEASGSGPEDAGLPSDLSRIADELVVPEWHKFDGPLRRYLAAKLHASWVPYQGRGLRTIVRSLAAALTVVRVESARQCARAGQPLDRSLLLEAIRAADRLLVHETDRDRLARAWSKVED